VIQIRANIVRRVLLFIAPQINDLEFLGRENVAALW